MQELISIVVPAFNEEVVLRLFHEKMTAAFDRLPGYDFEIVLVDDGSTDRTLDLMRELASRDARVCVVALSRNFGKEAALTAGLDYASGDAVAVFDADLQDPPALLIEFVRHWKAGYDVVFARRTHRDGESWLKKSTAAGFYGLMARISRVLIPRDTGDCRLMSRRAVDALGKLREHHRFMKGLFAWIGYPSIAVDYRRQARAAGDTKFNYWKLWNFALEGVTSFTTAPLRLATYVGFVIAFLAFVFGAWVIARTLIWGDVVRGYPTLMVTVLFLGGIQLFSIGVLGEYIGRIFGESKGRPLYLVQLHVPSLAAKVRHDGDAV
ncbi:glycosyltransferase [Caenimonas koreensis DSM 17982]|uniref:Glycosyltransferase n=1 Tax=Caenimonas koreensis DSM 17982 TaxID=1121255 RepID=A0A844AU02_9BURK|nr:glycosyltransferase family 2 protein [Caenimonas koreensis]MRD45828.1 glycosyltransferase [Caenimonas koreensis DSM 17982]